MIVLQRLIIGLIISSNFLLTLMCCDQLYLLCRVSHRTSLAMYGCKVQFGGTAAGVWKYSFCQVKVLLLRMLPESASVVS